MKNLLMVVSFICFSQFNQAAVLNCKVTSCRDVEKPSNTESWCSADLIQAQELIYNTSDMSLSEDKKSYILTQADGDQYTTVTFTRNDLQDINSDKIILGQMGDHFWWADGDHTRYVLDLKCSESH